MIICFSGIATSMVASQGNLLQNYLCVLGVFFSSYIFSPKKQHWYIMLIYYGEYLHNNLNNQMKVILSTEQV